MEIIRDQIIITVILDSVDQCGEGTCVTEHTTFDGVEDLEEVGVECVCAVGMGVTKIFDVFGEVAEEEDVVFADFAGNFNL